MANSLREATSKTNKKLLDILEYKEEFEAVIKEGVNTLLAKNPFSNKDTRNDPRNDLIVCARIKPLMENDDLLETCIARNPFTFAAELSFSFKNEPRVNFNKYESDFVFDQTDSDEKLFDTIGDSLIDMALAGGSGLYVSFGQTNSGKYQTFCKFLNNVVTSLLTNEKQRNVSNFISVMELQGNNLTDSLSSHSKLEIKENKNGSMKLVDVIENKLNSVEQYNRISKKVLSNRSEEKQERSDLICRIRIRETDPVDDGFLYLVCIAGCEQISCHSLSSSVKREIEQNQRSFLVLKECLRGRANSSVNPDQCYKVPYGQSKLTKIIKDVLDIGSSRQSRVVLVGHISPTVADFETTTDTLKQLAAIKAAIKMEENVKHPEENPVNWDGYEVNMWLRLTHELDIDEEDLLSGWQLLRLTRKEFVQFILSKTSISCETAGQIRTDLWQLYTSCRRKEEDRKLSQKEQFKTKDLPKKSYFEILNGDDNSAEDEKINPELGTSKRQFQEGLNKGFKQNLPRFAKKNAEMMAMEWSNKVAASDRVEAKLYPCLSVDTSKPVEVGERRRKNSIYK